MTNRSGPRDRITAEEAARIRRMDREGVEIADIAAAVGRRRQTIWRVLTGRVSCDERRPSDGRDGDKRRLNSASGGAKSAGLTREVRAIRPAGVTAKPDTDEWWQQCDTLFRNAMRRASGAPNSADSWDANHQAIS